jgi:anti-sigma B factor antagonist
MRAPRVTGTTSDRGRRAVMDQDLAIAVHRQLGHVLVTVVGEIDIATAPQLRAQLAGLAGTGQRVIVDLGQVRFSDAAGLGVLAGAAGRAAASGGSLLLAAARPQLRRLLAITGLDRHIPVTATVAEARAALRARHGA